MPFSPAVHDVPDAYTDFVQPFLIDHSTIRGRLVRLESTLNAILSAHNYPHNISALLAEQLVLNALLSATLKEDGILTVQAKGDGAIHTIITDTIAGGIMRGYVDADEKALVTLSSGNHSLSQLMGKGYLAVTLDQGGIEERYQGIVELHKDSLLDSFRSYFLQSQQGQVAVHMAIKPPDDENHIWRAGGIIIERMPHEGGHESALTPEEDDELWQRIALFTRTLSDEEMIDSHVTPQNLLSRLYNEDGVWVYKLQPLKAGCRCSRERIERALHSIAKDELLSTLNDQGTMTIHCEFCNKREMFNANDINQLYL